MNEKDLEFLKNLSEIGSETYEKIKQLSEKYETNTTFTVMNFCQWLMSREMLEKEVKKK